MSDTNHLGVIEQQLALLFYRNPRLVDTIKGLTYKMAQPAPSIETAVENLVAKGVLVKRRVEDLEAVAGDRKACRAFLASREEAARLE